MSIAAAAHGDQVENACRNGTWATCGTAVNQELQKNPTDPQHIVHLGILWSDSFSKRYDELRSKGRVNTSTADSEKIFEEIKSKLDPIEIGKDEVIDQLVKKYLPKVAPLLEWAGSPLAQALKAFFNSSEIASDYKELQLMNDSIQRKIAVLLSPFLKSDWKTSLTNAVQQAAPQLKMP